MTQAAQRTTVQGLEDALNLNFRICSERKNLETIRALHPRIKDSHLVLDPIEMGGDGDFGFNCPSCSARTRVFDFLDLEKAETDPRYCHAAFAPLEDLEVEQQNGRHCNKTSVGARVGSTQTGIPVNEEKSSQLVSFFLKLKNDGVFDQQLITGQPLPNCPTFDEGGEEGVALNISQLTGIWIVSFGFATAGLLVTWLQPKIEARRPRTVKPVHQFDQTGHRINVLEKDDQWKDSKSIMKGSQRVFIGESRWSKAGAKLGGASSTAFDVMSKRGPGGRSKSLNLDMIDNMLSSSDDDEETPKPRLRRAISLDTAAARRRYPSEQSRNVNRRHASHLDVLEETSSEHADNATDTTTRLRSASEPHNSTRLSAAYSVGEEASGSDDGGKRFG